MDTEASILNNYVTLCLTSHLFRACTQATPRAFDSSSFNRWSVSVIYTFNFRASAGKRAKERGHCGATHVIGEGRKGKQVLE